MKTPVGSQTAAYRRGLVLGLTMAEVFLLLVFCLLIALAALIAAGRKDLVAAEAEIRALVERAEVAEAALARLEPLARPTAGADPVVTGSIDRDWRRLVLDAGAADRLRAAGLDLGRLVEDRAFLAAVAPLAAGRTGDEVVAAVGLAEALAGELDAPGTDVTAVAARVLAAEEAARAAEARARAAETRAAGLDDGLAARAARPVDLPPIVTLRDDHGNFFETGSAVLSPAFASRIHDETVGELADLVARYDVDVIEVLGHTDERPVNFNRISNLDKALLDVVRGGSVADLKPADNAGLGLSRAVAVAQVLKADRRLAGVEVLPLSAAQLIDTDDRLTAGTYIADVRERRRIEIRLRRSHGGVSTGERAEAGGAGAVE